MKIGIGIDTGGTYTDAVAYDFDGKTILGSAKALTTKNDLTVGILNALDEFPREMLRQAEIISLSTTLATNACVEDKGGNAELIFFGGDKKVIDELGGKYGLPKSDNIYIQESFTRFSGDIERELDWKTFENAITRSYENCDGIGIVEIFAMKNGAVVEKKAKELFMKKHNIPVVCGHELFSQLNCLQRASSTLLNAGLFPVIKEFINSIKEAMTQRDMTASVVIVRSDGSLMSEEFAYIRPVETLLCGPAASVIGGNKLAGEPNSVIIDMGGTTTDIVLVKNNIPVKVTDGVCVGKWRTYVDGLYVKTFGLGGDSAIHYRGSSVFLEDYRVVPLCSAAAQYPQIIDNLRELADSGQTHHKFLHEHYILIKDISGSPRYTDEEKRICGILKNSPLILKDLSCALGNDNYTVNNISRLIKDGIVQICGFTPTDIMHIKGDFTSYSKEAALFGAKFVSRNIGITVDELCGVIYDQIKRKIFINTVKVMLENIYPEYLKHGVNPDAEQFINYSYDNALINPEQNIFKIIFKTDFKLVGIGAPIHIFLHDIAELLGTEAVVAPYYEVANAFGAIAGNILVTHSIEIKPIYEPSGLSGYTVFGNDENKTFGAMEEAEEFAVKEAETGAYKEAVRRGAAGDISVTVNFNKNEPDIKDGKFYLGTTVVATAVGIMGF